MGKNMILFGIKSLLLFKKINSKPVYNEKILKTKVKSYGDKAADYHGKEIPKAGSDCTCLAVITIDSALKEDENYYPQSFLKECKYKEKELISNIAEDIESFPSEYDE